MALINVVYRVHGREYERGWGSKPYHVDFDSKEKAEQFIKENEASRCLDRAPDYYETADRIEIVEVKS